MRSSVSSAASARDAKSWPLPEHFLNLAAEERRGVYAAAGDANELPPAVLEKDVWICWTLRHLFENPEGWPMAFKGGTSLSKVFKAIRRFSEDIDITVSAPSAESHPEDLSRRERDHLRITLEG